MVWPQNHPNLIFFWESNLLGEEHVVCIHYVLFWSLLDLPFFGDDACHVLATSRILRTTVRSLHDATRAGLSLLLMAVRELVLLWLVPHLSHSHQLEISLVPAFFALIFLILRLVILVRTVHLDCPLSLTQALALLETSPQTWFPLHLHI